MEQHCTLSSEICEEPTGKQLMPEIEWRCNSSDWPSAEPPYFLPESRVTRLDAEGVRVDNPIPAQTRIELVGHDGRAYLRRTNGVLTVVEQLVMDIRTWTALWGLPIDLYWVSASFDDGGGLVSDTNNQLALYNGSGQLSTSTGRALKYPSSDWEA